MRDLGMNVDSTSIQCEVHTPPEVEVYDACAHVEEDHAVQHEAQHVEELEEGTTAQTFAAQTELVT
jgi:hypothetical protein